MSASLILGVAGGVIGGFVGMAPLGFAIGSALGSYVDQSRTKQHFEGPRISDRRAQTSGYGMMLPITHGTMGITGNVIWASDLQEEEKTTEEGGKGGAPSTSTTTFEYFANFAISLGEGPKNNISRIWMNGKLWFDSQAENQGYTDWTFYPGNETQLPDPTIESFEGVGNVPAYRGQCYIVFAHVPARVWGNTPTPQHMQFEVNEASSVVNSAEIILHVEPYSFVTQHPLVAIGTDGAFWQWEYSGSGAPIYKLDPTNGNVLDTWSPGAGVYMNMLLPISGGYFWGWRSPPDNTHLALINPNAKTYAYTSNITSSGIEFGPIAACTLGDDLLMIQRQPSTWNFFPTRVSRGTNQTILKGNNIGVTNLQWNFLDALQGQYARGATDGTFYYAQSINNPGGQGYRIYRIDCSTMQLTSLHQSPTSGVASPGLEAQQLTYHNGLIYVSLFGAIDRWNPATMTWQTRLTGLTAGCSILTVAEDPRYFLYSQYGAPTIDVVEVASFVKVGTVTAPAADVGPMGKHPVNGRVYGIGYTFNKYDFFRVRTGSVGAEPVPLSTIVADYCQRAGLTAADIDVTQLADVDVRGTLLAAPCTARNALEPLMSAYFFDGVESEGKLKFVRRTGNVVATIPDSDLAQIGDELPRVNIQRSQDVDLPRTINVNYFEPARDYQAGTQYERRFGGFSDLQIAVEVPVAMDADEAKSIAQTWMYNAWMERERVTWATGIEYSALEPTDVISLHGLTVRINKRTDDGMLLRWEGVNDASQIYLQSGTGGQGQGGVQVPPAPLPTQARYLDIALLRDADDTSTGFYLAANGDPPAGWPGAQIYRSLDGGVNFDPYVAATAPATFGVTVTALQSWQSNNNTFDETSSVTVAMNGTLSSTTRALVLQGSNTLLIGDEIVQFAIATLIGLNQYRLTSLLRGRYGTEWAIGGHASIERVVLLNANVKNVTMQTSEIGLSRPYKAVTFGHLLENVAPENFTNTDVRHVCYTVVNMGGGRQANDDWVITWNRRTRKSHRFLQGSEAALGEPSESYAVQIMSGSVIKRTIYSAVQTATYLAADQVTDFGSVQTTLDVNIAQLSATSPGGVGRVRHVLYPNPEGF